MAKSSKTRKAARKPTKARSGRTMRLIDLDLSGGPKKRRPSGLPAPRTTTHKKRTVWFQARVGWPYRERSAYALLGERSRAAAALAPQTGTAQWDLVGPTNVGGRMTSIVCVPKKPNTIWAGAAGGGVWKSDDGGQHWQGLWHSQPTLNIGSLAVDPTNSSIVYCGTGEANLSADLIRELAFSGPSTAARAGTFLHRRIWLESRRVSAASSSIHSTRPTFVSVA